jgi:hypothetical protein
MAMRLRVSGFGRVPLALLAVLGLSVGGCAVVTQDAGQGYPVASQSGGYALTPSYPVAPAYSGGPVYGGSPAYGPSVYDNGPYYGPAQPYFPPSVYYAPPVIIAPPVIVRSAPLIAPHYAYGATRPVVINPAPIVVPPRVIAPSQGVAQVVQTRPSYGNAPPQIYSPRVQAIPSAPVQSFHNGGGYHAGAPHSGGSLTSPSYRPAPSVSAAPRQGGGGGFSSRRSR